MSIRLKILLPLILLTLGGLGLAAFEAWTGARENEKVTSVAASAIRAGEFTRKANEDFERLSDLLSEVSAMTHFIDADTIRKRFEAGVAATGKDFDGMREVALSPEMAKLGANARASFDDWRMDAAGTLGLEPAAEIAAADETKRKGEVVKRALNAAIELANREARMAWTK
jgi:hypothetical protein